MPSTPRLGIPLIASGQTQKDITHNEAILALGRIVALGVVSRSVIAPPSSVQAGSIYIVPASGGGGLGAAARHNDALAGQRLACRGRARWATGSGG